MIDFSTAYCDAEKAFKTSIALAALRDWPGAIGAAQEAERHFAAYLKALIAMRPAVQLYAANDGAIGRCQYCHAEMHALQAAGLVRCPNPYCNDYDRPYRIKEAANGG